jgi:hypothetical protein
MGLEWMRTLELSSPLRAFPGDDGCDAAGQQINFAKTKRDASRWAIRGRPWRSAIRAMANT